MRLPGLLVRLSSPPVSCKHAHVAWNLGPTTSDVSFRRAAVKQMDFIHLRWAPLKLVQTHFKAQEAVSKTPRRTRSWACSLRQASNSSKACQELLTSTYECMYVHTDRQTDRQTDRPTDRQACKHRDRHTYMRTLAHKHLHICMYKHTCTDISMCIHKICMHVCKYISINVRMYVSVGLLSERRVYFITER